MKGQILQYVLYVIILIALSIPLGKYMAKVLDGERTFMHKLFSPIERLIYKILRIDEKQEMTWKHYALCAILFNAIGLVFLTLIQVFQGSLPGNPDKIGGTSWSLAFNTASSFVTNTNWQSYSGESQLSVLTQALGLTVQNFVSAATGISVLYAMVRGFRRIKKSTVGSFWVDMTRTVLYILIPLSLVVAILIGSQGVVQSVTGSHEVKLLQPVAKDQDGNLIEGAIIKDNKVYVNGKEDTKATVVEKQFVPSGTAASQVAIKQLGTNGGGYFGVNSAFPLENPTAFTNLVEMTSILLIPVALCFSFGYSIKNKKQGYAIFAAMLIMLIMSMSVIAVNEGKATPQLAQNGIVNTSYVDQNGGNMEGKESRFGIATSVTWAGYTTAASNGSVNSMHDSYTPLGGMITMLQMQLGEVIFGGVGCGLYGMLAFAILTVFISGLMVGRTPEFLGKKIEPYEMKWAVLVCLATPIGILVGSGVAAAVPGVIDTLNNGGAHGFSELLYNFSSAGGNNGSAFAGMGCDTPFLNIALGLTMIFVRFLPIIGTLAIAGNMVEKKKIAVTSGTLSTTNAMFVFLLIFVVLLIGALSFLPALALGPIAEFSQMEFKIIRR